MALLRPNCHHELGKACFSVLRWRVLFSIQGSSGVSVSILHHEEALSLKSLSFDESGGVSRRRTIGPLDFTFSSHGLTWSCRFLEKQGRARLTMAAGICSVPGRPERMEAIAALIRAAKTAGLHFTIQEGHVMLFDHHPLSIPVTPARLLAALAKKVVVIQPWVYALQDASSGALFR